MTIKHSIDQSLFVYDNFFIFDKEISELEISESFFKLFQYVFFPYIFVFVKGISKKQCDVMPDLVL